MIFSNLLYIFQSEHYDRLRFLRFVYRNISSWHSFSDRGSLDWTLRAKLLMAGGFGILMLDFFLITLLTQNFWIWGIALVLAVLAFPLYLVVADYLLAPLLTWKKQKIFSQAEKILAEAKTQKKFQVVGITGSYGKTSFKNMLQKILQTQFSVMTIPGNINTDLGVANYLIAHQAEVFSANFLLVEMGAFTTGEIQSICDVVHPEYSFLTAIGPVHLERFGSIENTAKAKFELPNATSKKAYLNAQNQNIQNFFPENFSAFSKTAQHYLSEISKEFSDQIFLPEFSGISFSYQGKTFSTPLISEYIFEFFAMIFPFATAMGISPENLQKGVSQLEYTPHRLQVIKNKQTGITVIDDSYNGNFSGFLAGIEVLSRAKNRKVVLTPGIVELGELQKKTHQDLAQLYIQKKIDLVLLIKNSNTQIIQKIFEQENFTQYKVYADVHQAHADLPNVLKKGDTIIFQNDLSDNYK